MNFLEKLDYLMGEENIDNRKELAKKSGVPYTTIMSFYNRSYENISLPTAKSLAKALNVSVDFFTDEIKNAKDIDIYKYRRTTSDYIQENTIDELNEYDILFNKYKDLSENDKRWIIDIIETRKKQIDEELDGKQE